VRPGVNIAVGSRASSGGVVVVARSPVLTITVEPGDEILGMQAGRVSEWPG
jgi:hypothetical protein